MELKDARNQRRLFFYITGKNRVIVNIDKIISIDHTGDKTKIFYFNGYLDVDDENYVLFNKLGYLLVNDFEEVKAEKEQG